MRCDSGSQPMLALRGLPVLMVPGGLGACESIDSGLEKLDNNFLKRDPERLIEAGALRLNGAEATEHVSGNTELVWLKIKSEGSWTLSSEGRVCLSTPTGKNRHDCLARDGTITSIDGAKTNGVLKVEPGEKLRP